MVTHKRCILINVESAVISGVQARMKQLYPLADYFHCASHKLNLVASDAAAVTSIARFLSRVQGVLVYFDGSPKRLNDLKTKINEMLPNTRKERVQQICPTRWVDRHRTLVSFAELYGPITATLQSHSVMDNERTAEDLLNGTYQSLFKILTKKLFMAINLRDYDV